MADPFHLRGPDGFPRAPSHGEWIRLTPEQRAAVLAALPDEVTDAEMHPPEGDLHYEAKNTARDTLRRYFRGKGRSVYIAAELPVYYPAQRRFAPDLLAVLDVPTHQRGKWVVDHEGKGLDFVLEVHVGGDRKKDAVDNVAFYAQLGIPEYFIYDRASQRLLGYRLDEENPGRYIRIVPQGGRLHSDVLGFDLAIEEGQLRFSDAGAFLPDADEIIGRLQRLAESAEQRADAEAERVAELADSLTAAQKRAEAERERAETERARAEAAERRLRELEDQLNRGGR
jgi:Uma2 family endonuclease